MRVLGLDLSTNVGIAYWIDDAPVYWATKRLPKVEFQEDYGGRMFPLATWLEKEILDFRPEIVAMESPFLPINEFNVDGPRPATGARFRFTAHGIRLQISLAAAVELVVARHNAVRDFKVRCIEVASASAKIALAGTAKLGSAKKTAMVAAARKRGWAVTDDHQADAIAVGMVIRERYGEAKGTLL